MAHEPAMLISNPLNESPLTFPILECFHLAGMALLVGTVAIGDFRVFGWGMRRQGVTELAKSLAPWTLVGLVLVLLSGPMMFSSDPDMYYLNWVFVSKMVILALAITFNYTIRRKTLKSGSSPARAKVVAGISLALWVLVIGGGIFIAFV